MSLSSLPPDRGELVRIANNRHVWRNLSHVFPHPYTWEDADRWFTYIQDAFPVTHWGIEVEGELMDAMLYAAIAKT